jgi:hypothetical protein
VNLSLSDLSDVKIVSEDAMNNETLQLVMLRHEWIIE